MKGTCNRDALEKALSVACRIAPSQRTPLEIIKNALFVPDQDCVTVAATDLETAIVIRVPANLEGTESIAVPARIVRDFIALMDSEEVHLELDDRNLRVSNAHVHASFVGANSEDFPLLPDFASARLVSVPAELLRRLIRQVAFAASDDTTRQSLTGILFSAAGDKLQMVATDGYRLSISSGIAIESVQEAISALIPAQALERIEPVLQGTVQVGVSHDQKRFIIRGENIDVAIHLLDQKFPAYDSVIPRAWQTRAVVPRKDLLHALRQASIFARESVDAVRLSVNPKSEEQDAHIVVSVDANQSGETKSSLESLVEGNGISVLVNVRFLIAALNALDCDQISIEMSAANKPISIRPEPDDNSYLHILMPMLSPAPSST